MKLVATHSNVHAADLVTTPRRAPNADRGWTVFEIPSTPGFPAAVGSATCGPDRARLARAGTRSSSSDVVSQRAGSQQWRLRSSIGEGEMLRARSPAPTHGSSYFIFSVAERVSRRLLVLRSARPGHREHMSAREANISVSEDQQHARVLSTKPRTQHGGVVSCPQNSERSRARAQVSRHPSPSTQLRRWTRRSGLCVSGARWTPSSAASTPGCGCR